jgi:hypothetical protein
MIIRLAVGLFLASTLTDATGQAPIYKCERPGHSVTYQDSPCGPRQIQRAFLPEAATADPLADAALEKDSGTATIPRQGPMPSKGARDMPVPAPQAPQRSASQVENDPSLPPSMTAVVQTLTGLAFASLLVALVAWKARKRSPGRDDTRAVSARSSLELNALELSTSTQR